MTLARVIEALLFSAQKPLPAREIVATIKAAGGDDELLPNEFGEIKEADVAAALEELKVEYIFQERGFQLAEKAEGWQFVTDPKFAPWVQQLFPAPKPARLSSPLLRRSPSSLTGSRSPGPMSRPCAVSPLMVSCRL